MEPYETEEALGISSEEPAEAPPANYDGVADPDDALGVADIEAEIDQLEREIKAQEKPEQPEQSQELTALQQRLQAAEQEAAQGRQLRDQLSHAAQEYHRQQQESAFEEDPAGALRSEVEQLKQERQLERQHAAFNQAVQATNASEAEFAKQQPDYYDVLQESREMRARILQAAHPNASPEWVQQQITTGDRLHALQSLQQGIDPATRAYQTGKAMVQAARGGQPANQAHLPQAAGYPQAPAPASRPAPRPKYTSLSNASGRNVSGRKVTYEQAVDNTTDEEFDALFNDPHHRQQLDQHGFTYL